MSSGSAYPVLLYDGACGLCDRSVQFVLRHDAQGLFRFAALQSALGRATLAAFGRDAGTLDTVCVHTPEGQLLDRSRAALYVLAKLGGGFRTIATLLRLVPRPLADLVYDGIARVRYRVFGRLVACRVPSADVRGRFLDAEGEAVRP